MSKKKEVDLKAQAMAAAEGLKCAIINEGNENERPRFFKINPDGTFETSVCPKEPKVIEYECLATHCPKTTIEMVNEAIKQGFQPVGFMQAVQDARNLNFMYFQTMVKYD